MKDKEIQPYLRDLVSLGCAYAIKRPVKVADPENTILSSLRLYWDKPDIFQMLVGVLVHRIYDLIHVERLFSLAQDLSVEEKILLKGICHKLHMKGDKRYSLITGKLNTGRSKIVDVPKANFDPYLLKQYGLDKDFLKFKVKMLDGHIPPERKFFTKASIVENNAWLRLRVLVGPTYRSDLVYLKSAKIVKTPVEAIALMGCSRAVVYDLWNKLSACENLESLIA